MERRAPPENWIKHFAIATLVPVVVLIIAMLLSPLWRDEYYTLFMADPDMPALEILRNRLAWDVHPPLHPLLIRYWIAISSNVFFVRCFSLLTLAISGLMIWHISRQEDRDRGVVFLLICLGSGWIAYFSIQIRHYVFLFCLSALATLLVQHLIKDNPPKLRKWCFWLTIGACLSLTHYFGALWFASLSLVCGLYCLKQNQFSRFVILGTLALLAILPSSLWVYFFSWNEMPRGFENSASWGLLLVSGSFELLMGQIMRTLSANPLITILGIGGVFAAVRGRGHPDPILIRACALTIILALIFQITISPVIKDRTFIVIMPAIFYIFAGHIVKHMNYNAALLLPFVTALMPLIFFSSYISDYEKTRDLQSDIVGWSHLCEKQLIAVYYPPPDEYLEFYKYATAEILKFNQGGKSFDPEIVAAKAISKAPPSTCPVKAAALFLHGFGAPTAELARKEIEGAGFNLSRLQEKQYGSSLQIIWIDPDPAADMIQATQSHNR